MAKKTVKKILKALLIGGAGYLGAKALGGKKGLKGADVEGARGANLRGILKSKMPGNLSPDLGASTYVKPKWKMPKDPMGNVYPNVPFRGGGIAKGGKGVALKHGGHVKSMGIATRGGGVAKK